MEGLVSTISTTRKRGKFILSATLFHFIYNARMVYITLVQLLSAFMTSINIRPHFKRCSLLTDASKLSSDKLRKWRKRILAGLCLSGNVEKQKVKAKIRSPWLSFAYYFLQLIEDNFPIGQEKDILATQSNKNKLWTTIVYLSIKCFLGTITISYLKIIKRTYLQLFMQSLLHLHLQL